MVAISAEYRIKNIHNSTPKDSLNDARKVMQYLRENCYSLNINPTKIVASGSSAGGHLAATLATIKEFNIQGLKNYMPDALALIVPVIDNSKIGFGFNRVKTYWQQFSPLHNIKKEHPPTIIFNSSKDEKIREKASLEYIEKLINYNIDCELYTFKDSTHSLNEKEIYFTVRRIDYFLQKIKFLEGKATLEDPPKRDQKLKELVVLCAN
jgi:acetyl esterase/lipase